MKLPSDTSQNKALTSVAQSQSSKTSGGQSVLASSNTKTALSPKVQALINTWAKVQTSQTLPPEQNRQVLNQLRQLAEQPSNPIAQRANLKDAPLTLETLTANLNKGAALSPSLTLNLVKLLSVKGAISILTDKPFEPGNQVFLNQSSKGQLLIHNQNKPQILNQFRTQFIANTFNPKPMALVESRQILSTSTAPLNPSLSIAMSSPPSSILHSQIPLAPSTVQQAFKQNGQNLEVNIKHVLLQTPQAQQASPKTTTSTDVTRSFTQQIVKVEQSIQKWVAEFQQALSNKPQSTSQPITPNLSAIQTKTETKANQITQEIKQQSQQGLLTQDAQTATSSKSKSTVNLPPDITSGIKQDTKQWLIQNQVQLISQLNQQLSQHKDSFIPNWPALPLGGQESVNIKTFNDLSQWLTLLMLPKSHNESQGLPLWPKNLSVQPQIQQTLQALLNSFNQGDDNSAESALLRQLLSINQSISKLIHDQIQNRIWQTQGDTLQYQTSLPYVHQNHLHWCEFECKQQPASQNEKQLQRGWHLILRFAQDSPQAFAIESYLKQEILSITLWASEKSQLKELHDNIPLMREKLENAGFKLEKINTQHGSPKPLNQPIQQSLIDVHT